MLAWLEKLDRSLGLSLFLRANATEGQEGSSMAPRDQRAFAEQTPRVGTKDSRSRDPQAPPADRLRCSAPEARRATWQEDRNAVVRASRLREVYTCEDGRFRTLLRRLQAPAEDQSDRIEALEQRIRHLETQVEGFQDSVHRESVRRDRDIRELQATSRAERASGRSAGMPASAGSDGRDEATAWTIGQR